MFINLNFEYKKLDGYNRLFFQLPIIGFENGSEPYICQFVL